MAHGQGPAARSLFQDGVVSYSELYIRYRGAADEAPFRVGGAPRICFRTYRQLLELATALWNNRARMRTTRTNQKKYVEAQVTGRDACVSGLAAAMLLQVGNQGRDSEAAKAGVPSAGVCTHFFSLILNSGDVKILAGS